ncbi:hypothetical protein OH77DRAFT_1424995 [Trametes cingulata]|nr:hypothetical protein OH77DRAFT_1424995 [Trametes cingulata]
MTPRPLACDGCREESSSLKCCSACKKVWYCSKECQTRSWRRHIFECNRKGPIGTAYYLSRACHDDLIPVHAQTRKEYGFDKAVRLLGDGAQSKVLGLWVGVFIYREVSEKEVQRWQAEGKLVEGVKATFERESPYTKGAYYAWFLKHQYILDDSPVDEELESAVAESSVRDAVLRAWAFTGGSPGDSYDAIEAAFQALPEHKRACHWFYRMSLMGGLPSPQVDPWVSFGFVSAKTQYEELQIGRMYRALIRRCTFDEFCAAYETSTLPKLGEDHGLLKDDSSRESLGSSLTFFRDVMSESPRRYKSVWYLKQYIDILQCTDAAERPELPHKAVNVDYGFFNCKKPWERPLLEELYTKYFTHSDADPLELHKACVAGELAEYLARFVKLSPRTQTYKRLLQNPYPVPAYGESQGVASAESVTIVIH